MDFLALEEPMTRSHDTVYLNERKIVRLLEREVASAGGQSKWARENALDRSNLNRVLNGRIKLSAVIWQCLGVEVVYMSGDCVLTAKQVLAALRAAVDDANGPLAWTRRNRVDRKHLDCVLKGKRSLSPSILSVLGMRAALIAPRAERTISKRRVRA
jgi:hypothetical protein